MARMIPLAVMEQMLKEAGAPRVSEDAKEALKRQIEKEGRDLAKEAVKLAQFAGRRTVLDKDIEMATERLRPPHA